MPLPITVPFTFGNATTTQSLSSLDADFSTVYNAVNGIGNGTVSLANVSITGGSIAANITASGIFSGTSNVSITSANGPVSINTNGTNAMYINALQNVGIGTTSPSFKLDVQATTGSISSTSTTGTNLAKLQCNNSGGSYQFGIDNSIGTNFGSGIAYSRVIWNDSTTAPTIFYTNSTERMRIDALGNLLVGNTTSLIGIGGSIQAVGYSTNRGYLSMGRTTAATSGVCGSLIGYNATDAIASFDFQANGANNSGVIQAYTYSAGSSVQGPYVNTGGTSWTTASDENLKDIIEPIENGIEKLSSLRSVIGKFKTDHDDVRRVFLIAQDVQKVLPEATCIDQNGYLGLNYQDLIPVLVKAIQELSAKNDALEARLVALESK